MIDLPLRQIDLFMGLFKHPVQGVALGPSPGGYARPSCRKSGDG